MTIPPWVMTVCAVVLGAAGIVALVLVAKRRPGRGVLAAAGAVAALWIAAVSQLVLPSGGEPWASALMTAAIPAVLALYPDARSAGTAGWLVSGVAVGLAVVYLIAGETVAQQPGWNVIVGATALAGVAAAIVRYRRRMDTAQHAAVRWALLGGLVTLQGMTVLVIAGQLAGGQGIWSLGAVGQVGVAFLVLAFPAMATTGLIAGTRGSIDLALRAVVAGSVTLWGVAAAAWVAVLLARAAAWSDGTTVATVALVAAATGIVGWWIGARLADLLVFGGRPDPAQASASTSAAIAGATSVEELLRVVAIRAQRSIGSEAVRAEAYGTSVTVLRLAGFRGARPEYRVHGGGQTPRHPLRPAEEGRDRTDPPRCGGRPSDRGGRIPCP
jgi:hypothetical protein